MTKKLDEAKKEIAEILKKHGVEYDWELEFPRYKILPDEVLLAIKILNKHGMKIVFSIAFK